jgi:DNA-binding NtrC family response regulator
MAYNILIVDDDHITRTSLNAVLQNRGFICTEAENGKDGFSLISQQEFDVVISDIEMPKMSGIELLEKANKLHKVPSFIIITAFGSLETAIEALRKGAYDYMIKPVNFEDVAIRLEKLLEHKKLVRENVALRQEVNSQYGYSNIIGKSKAIKAVFSTVQKVAESESNVLITGKSGTGKELVAKSIHYNSTHSKGRFLAVNCGAITETLFESELFGHKKGSFTGAVNDNDGLFRAAHNGTLFLDEIAEMPLPLQAKLLRALETKEILPVGATATIKVHVRIIAATNTNLMGQVKKGLFREDLYYRLNVIEIKLPSLSDRREDIPLLVDHFVKKYNRQMSKRVTQVDPPLLSVLINRQWQGEVRELENFIERMMIFAHDDTLRMEDLPSNLLDHEEPVFKMPNETELKMAVENFERQYIYSVLGKNNFHKTKTAKALGIGEATLYRKMNQLKIDSLS